MQDGLRAAGQYQRSVVITDAHAIRFEPLPPVLATPFLIWLMEETAMELLHPFLEDDELSVGTKVEIEHLDVAQPGETVTFSAAIVNCDGRDLLFSVEAHCRGRLLAKGLHRRKLVSKSRMQQRLQHAGS